MLGLGKKQPVAFAPSIQKLISLVGKEADLMTNKLQTKVFTTMPNGMTNNLEIQVAPNGLPLSLSITYQFPAIPPKIYVCFNNIFGLPVNESFFDALLVLGKRGRLTEVASGKYELEWMDIIPWIPEMPLYALIQKVYLLFVIAADLSSVFPKDEETNTDVQQQNEVADAPQQSEELQV